MEWILEEWDRQGVSARLKSKPIECTDRKRTRMGVWAGESGGRKRRDIRDWKDLRPGRRIG